MTVAVTNQALQKLAKSYATLVSVGLIERPNGQTCCSQCSTDIYLGNCVNCCLCAHTICLSCAQKYGKLEKTLTPPTCYKSHYSTYQYYCNSCIDGGKQHVYFLTVFVV